MNIYDFADCINKDIVITRYNNQNNRFCVTFPQGDIQESNFIVGVTGNGDTPIKALNDYKDKIVGKKLVFNALGKGRHEFIVPKTLIDVEK